MHNRKHRNIILLKPTKVVEIHLFLSWEDASSKATVGGFFHCVRQLFKLFKRPTPKHRFKQSIKPLPVLVWWDGYLLPPQTIQFKLWANRSEWFGLDISGLPTHEVYLVCNFYNAPDQVRILAYQALELEGGTEGDCKAIAIAATLKDTLLLAQKTPKLKNLLTQPWLDGVWYDITANLVRKANEPAIRRPNQ